MIDVERLKTDPDYWDEVAPEGATHYAPETGDYGAVWMQDPTGDQWKVFSCISHEWVIDLCSDDPKRYIPRPTKTPEAEWDGTGLPPVGVECEFIHPGIKRHGWQKGVVKAAFDDRIIIRSNPHIWENDGLAFLLVNGNLIFRPIRTKEQRLREEVIDAALALDQYPNGELAGGLLSRRDFCGKLYDCGLLSRISKS